MLNHSKGGETFEYRIKMNEFHSKRTHWWGDDYYGWPLPLAVPPTMLEPQPVQPCLEGEA